jgi:hypothetical protein
MRFRLEQKATTAVNAVYHLIDERDTMTARLSIPIDSARSRCLHTIMKMSRIVFDSLISSKKDS